MGGVLGEWIYRIDGFRQWGSFVQVLDVRYPDQALRNVRRSVVGTSYSNLFRNGSSAYGGVYGGQERAQASGADALGHRLWGLRAGGQCSTPAGRWWAQSSGLPGTMRAAQTGLTTRHWMAPWGWPGGQSAMN